MRNLDILAAESGEHVRVLLCREEQSYVVSCQHFRMPYPVASDLLAELQPVPAETYSVFVLDEDITNRQREGRNRKLNLIAPLLEDACIYDKSHRNEVVRQIAAEHGLARRTVLQYLWRYWVYQSKNALLPAERPAPEQHELTADEKAIRWALNKYYYTPQRQSLQTAYKMMLRAKYCDTHGTLKPEYPTFWQFRYFFRKNRDLLRQSDLVLPAFPAYNDTLSCPPSPDHSHRIYRSEVIYQINLPLAAVLISFLFLLLSIFP